MNRYKEVKLGDIADVIAGQSPNGTSYNKDGQGKPFYQGNRDYGRKFLKSPSVWTDSATKLAREGDILISVRAPVGDLNISTQEICIGRGLAAIRAKENISNEYLYYYLLSISDTLDKGDGTIFSSISKKQIENIRFILPSMPEQRCISSILETLDDKIELNQQMNETLESMAQAIFQDWFIDFGPTRRKMQGATDPDVILGGLFSTPGKSREIANLFPTILTDNGLPKGWKKARLGDFDFEIESGKRPKGGIDKSLKFGIPSIGAENLAKVGNFDYSKVKFVDSDFAKFVKQGWVQNYDVAIYKDGAMVGNPDRVSLFGNNFPFSKFIVNEHVFLIRSLTIGQPFLYFLFKSDSVSSYLKSIGASKAAQPGLNQQEVRHCEFVFPASELFMTFEKMILMLLDKQLANGKESCLLEKIRNLLLPSLISGQIIVREMEI